MATPKGPAIRLKDVSVVYEAGEKNATKALDNVSVEIPSGELVVIFGPSGCGKSTLLYTIAGLERPTSGEAAVYGVELSKLRSNELAKFRRERIGFIFQAFYLIPSFTVLNNIVLPQIFARTERKAREERATALLKGFGVLEQKRKFPSGLSGGQQQRVAIARALVNNPQLVLADEPTGNLDDSSADVIMHILLDLAEKEGRTVVLVSHDPRYLRLAHRIFWMQSGRIVRSVEQRSLTGKHTAPVVLETLARRFPYASETSLKAKALLHYLYDGYDWEVQQRIEQEVKNLLEGRLSFEQFSAFLDRPVKDGGAGFYRQSAEATTGRFKGILEATERLSRIRRIALDIPVLLRNELTSLLGSIIAAGAHLQDDQRERIIAEAGKRFLGQIGSNDLLEFLDRPWREGGAGLDERIARKIFWDIEMMMVEYAR